MALALTVLLKPGAPQKSPKINQFVLNEQTFIYL